MTENGLLTEKHIGNYRNMQQIMDCHDTKLKHVLNHEQISETCLKSDFCYRHTTADINICRSILSEKNAINYLSMNIRSLNKNYDSLVIFLQHLKVDIDVIILTETWNGKFYREKHIPGYESFHTNFNHTQNDGIVIYIKESLSFLSVQEIAFPEANCLQINIDSATSLLAVYRSPSVNNINYFLESLDAILCANKNTQNLFLCGDLNISIAGTLHPQSEEYLNVLMLHGLRPEIIHPTREYNSSSSCIDHVMVRTKNLISTIVYKNSITDHYTTFFKVVSKGSPKVVHPNNQIKKVFNYDKIVDEISQYDWNELYQIRDANDSYNLFLSILITIVQKHTSSKTVIIKHKNKKMKPWITDGLLFCIRRRDKMHAALRKSPDDAMLRQKYSRYRNLCNKIIKLTKQQYYKKQITDSARDPRKMWINIKEAANWKNRSDVKLTSIKIDNEIITMKDNPEKLLSCTNSHFCNVGSKLAEKFHGRNRFVTNDLNKSYTSPVSMFLTPTNRDEVKKVIGSLKNRSAVGDDGVGTCVLKLAETYLSQPISFIINASFKTGIFPEKLKTAKVIPIHKGGDNQDLNNYRPISILNTISKIFEKVAKARLYKFLIENKILSNNQFGFREGLGTTDAITALTEFIVQTVDKGDKCLGVFLDLAKAFDSVPHDILLCKLSSVGINYTSLKWFDSYLANRIQSVTIQGRQSESQHLKYGVPQGSVLGPILFLVYINDLCQLPVGKVITYADDTVILFKGSNWDTTFEKANEGMEIVRNWLGHFMLTLNVGKTKYMPFSINNRGQPTTNKNIIVHGCDSVESCNCQPLQREISWKYLGITLDCFLRWESHIRNLSTKVRILGYVFKELRNILDPKTLKTVYHALCESLITYGIIGWGGCAKTLLEPLQVAQKMILKIILRRPYRHPTNELYMEAKVFDCRQLFLKTSLLKLHLDNNSNFRTLQNRRPTRQVLENNLVIPRLKTSFGQRHYSFITPRFYNLINLDIKMNLAFSVFKNKIIKWLSDHDRITIHQMLEIIT